MENIIAKIKKGFIIICLVLVFCSSSFVLAADSGTNQANKYSYENYEKIPGQKRTKNFVVYLQQLYTFGISIVAILAIFMVAFGAFTYIITSAGNASKMADAKDMIFNAIFGLILALVAFLILHLINPDLVKGTVMKFSGAQLTVKEVNGKTVKTSNKYSKYNEICTEKKQSSDDSTKPIDYTKASNKPTVTKCNDYDNLFEKYGSKINSGNLSGKCILKAIASIESQCVPNVKSKKGACGLMQLLESTANASCAELINNPELSVKKAADYISQNINGCVNNAKNKLSAVFAGYNSGYGCSNCSGKKSGLCASSDCPGSLAFECCINPGDLDETIAYAWNATGYYNYCMGQKSSK